MEDVAAPIGWRGQGEALGAADKTDSTKGM